MSLNQVKLKCAYVWTTSISNIYIWTTKIRPTLPPWPYYVNALVVWAWAPWWYYRYKKYAWCKSWWGWWWAVCCYSSLQTNIQTPVVIWTSPAGNSCYNIIACPSCITVKSGTCVACWWTTGVSCNLAGWNSWSWCTGWYFEYYSERLGWWGWWWASWNWCSAYASWSSAVWWNWWAWLYWYGWWGWGTWNAWDGSATDWWWAGWYAATNYWWGWWWTHWSQCPYWYPWCQWMVEICYKIDWSCWYSKATWWQCCYICNWYCVHRFTSGWTFQITW